MQLRAPLASIYLGCEVTLTWKMKASIQLMSCLPLGTYTPWQTQRSAYVEEPKRLNKQYLPYEQVELCKPNGKLNHLWSLDN